MPTFTSFEQIHAWQEARVLCEDIFLMTTNSLLTRDYKLKDQIIDSSGSIMNNIAEGFGRGRNGEFIQHLEISHASACDCQSQLYRVLDRKYIPEEKFKKLYQQAEEVKLMIFALIKYLLNSELKGPKFSKRKQEKKSE